MSKFENFKAKIRDIKDDVVDWCTDNAMELYYSGSIVLLTARTKQARMDTSRDTMLVKRIHLQSTRIRDSCLIWPKHRALGLILLQKKLRNEN